MPATPKAPDPLPPPLVEQCDRILSHWFPLAVSGGNPDAAYICLRAMELKARCFGIGS